MTLCVESARFYKHIHTIYSYRLKGIYELKVLPIFLTTTVAALCSLTTAFSSPITRTNCGNGNRTTLKFLQTVNSDTAAILMYIYSKMSNCEWMNTTPWSSILHTFLVIATPKQVYLAYECEIRMQNQSKSKIAQSYTLCDWFMNEKEKKRLSLRSNDTKVKNHAVIDHITHANRVLFFCAFTSGHYVSGKSFRVAVVDASNDAVSIKWSELMKKSIYKCRKHQTSAWRRKKSKQRIIFLSFTLTLDVMRMKRAGYRIVSKMSIFVSCCLLL